MDGQQITDLAKRGYECFLRGDIPGLMDLCADDIEWIVPDMQSVPFGGTRKGKQELMQFFQSYDASLHTTSFVPREFIAQGDTVVVLGHFDGEAKPTGRQFSNDWVHVLHYRDGKLARFQQYGDTAATEAAFSPRQASQPMDLGTSATRH